LILDLVRLVNLEDNRFIFGIQSYIFLISTKCISGLIVAFVIYFLFKHLTEGVSPPSKKIKLTNKLPEKQQVVRLHVHFL